MRNENWQDGELATYRTGDRRAGVLEDATVFEHGLDDVAELELGLDVAAGLELGLNDEADLERGLDEVVELGLFWYCPFMTILGYNQVIRY